MAKNELGLINTAMADFAELIKSSGLDASDFRVLVRQDRWARFVMFTTGRPHNAESVTKVTLGEIDFIPDK